MKNSKLNMHIQKDLENHAAGRQGSRVGDIGNKASTDQLGLEAWTGAELGNIICSELY